MTIVTLTVLTPLWIAMVPSVLHANTITVSELFPVYDDLGTQYVRLSGTGRSSRP